MPKRITICRKGEKGPHGCGYYVAVAEDGLIITGHGCSSKEWAKHDLMTNDWLDIKRKYLIHYPEGYELVDCRDSSYEDIFGGREAEEKLWT